MDSQGLLQIAKRRSKDIFLYEASYFTLRLQEEMVRSDISGLPFGLLELPFAVLDRLCPPEIDPRDFWDAVMTALLEHSRGSDFKGILPDGVGLGVVLPESERAGVEELVQRMFATMISRMNLPSESVDQASKFLPIGVYPHDIRNGTGHGT
jgi:hypothetical protein